MRNRKRIGEAVRGRGRGKRSRGPRRSEAERSTLFETGAGSNPDGAARTQN